MIENSGVDVGLVLLGDHRLLGRIHTADIGAVILADCAVARADALNPGNPMGFLVRRRGARMWPPNGPAADRMRSYSRLVTTLGHLP